MNKKFSFVLLGVLILEYLFIFTFLLNYDVAWVNPEKFGVHAWILSNGSQWKPEDWTKFLNINVIEDNAYRLSRPLSNFIEVVDTKWRASMWNHMTPHPAVSLQWPFMFILLPWLLYLTFTNMGCLSAPALTGVCIYVASMGFLGPLVMLFHPAKSLVNFFGVLAMFLFSVAYRRELTYVPPLKSGAVVLAGYAALFLGFFSDETGTYLYPMAILLFYRLWLKLWSQRRLWVLSGLALLPVLYFLTIKFFLPYLHFVFMGQKIELTEYDCFPSPVSLFLPDPFFLWQNTKFLFADHPHLLIDYKELAGHPWIMTVQLVYVLAFLFLTALFLKGLLDKNKKDPNQKVFLALLSAGVILMAGFCFFQTFQLSKNVKAWGIWWYGSLFSLLFIYPFVFFLQWVYGQYPKLQKWAVVFGIIFAINGLVFTTYRISIFKLQNLNRTAYSFMGIFTGTVNPYNSFDLHTTLEQSHCKWMYAHLYWRHWKKLPDDIDPVEKNKCYSGVLAGDLYFLTEEYMYLPSELPPNRGNPN